MKLKNNAFYLVREKSSKELTVMQYVGNNQFWSIGLEYETMRDKIDIIRELDLNKLAKQIKK